MIADDDPENYEADDDEVDEIASYIYEWRKDSQEPLPLWLEIAAAIALIYGPKYNQAFKFKKAKKMLKIAEDNQEILLQELIRIKEDLIIKQHDIDKLEAEKKTNAEKTEPIPSPSSP